MSSNLYWTNLNPATSPTMRYSAAMNFFPPTGQIILFGGQSAPGGNPSLLLDDTWAYNPSTNAWTPLTPTVSPPPTDGAGTAYDPTANQIIMFGGLSTTGHVNTTWAYQTNTWTNLAPTGAVPSTRNGPSMAYNPGTSTIILFGGYNDITQDNNDTWSFDSQTNTWTQLFPALSPPPRDSASLAYDAVSGNLILFGGYSNGTNLSDTWSFNATTVTWTNLTPTTSPSARYGNALQFDTVTNTLILFGGAIYPNPNPGDFYGDTWTYASATNTWTQLTFGTTPVTPSAREFSMMTMDPTNGQMILFGGVNNFSNPQSQNDTWALIVGTSPTITSVSSQLSATQVPFSFTVTTTGTPAIAITEAGALPAGVTFFDNGDGTATLSGTPMQSGVFQLILTATNMFSPPGTQFFTLVINQGIAPAITSPDSTTDALNVPLNFTVTTTGSPVPSITEAGTLPTGVTFVDNGDGTGTLAGTPTQSGTFLITFTASNGILPQATQQFTLVIETALPPIDLHVIRTCKCCEGKKRYFNVLVWGQNPNSSPIAQYKIYRSKCGENPNNDPIAVVPMPGALYYTDKIKKGKSYTYYITAVDQNGNVSAPIKLKVRWKKRC